MSLPKPNDPRGYTNAEIKKICRDRGILTAKFNVAFGCNTATYDIKTKQTLFYVCDVETALARLGHPDGINNGFD
jgi:hypothetical protein